MKKIAVVTGASGGLGREFVRLLVGTKVKLFSRDLSDIRPIKELAKKALKDANKNKDMSVYSLYIKSCHVIAKILPQRFMMKIWLRQQNINAKA